MGMGLTNWLLLGGFVGILEVKYIAAYATMRQGYESFPTTSVRYNILLQPIRLYHERY